MRASSMNLSIASKIVVIEADDHAAPYLEPMTLDAMHALEQRAGLGPHILQFLGFDQRRFIWALDALASIKDASFGLSMPTKTLQKLASPINCISSSSSARSSVASVESASG